MDQLNLPAVLTELAARPKGLILVTGPTGSGKSKHDLAAMIDWINRNETRHILTIEDPVGIRARKPAFTHSSPRSRDAHLKFHNALRAAFEKIPM